MKKIKIMIKQISKIAVILLLLIFITGCSTSKKRGERELAFIKYLDIRKIDTEKLNDGNYTDFYLEFLNDEKKKSLLSNSYLKVNKVYVYQGNNNTITFSVYSDDGELYLAQANKTGSTFLTEPKNGKIQFKQRMELNPFGLFELNDTIVKNTSYEKTSFKEYYYCCESTTKNDTITLKRNYRTKKFGSYKKKWLAKTHKTNFNFIYQPDLRAIKSKNSSGFDAFLIEGSFNAERNLEEEKMLQLLENVKY
jgi:hypothetical protein